MSNFGVGRKVCNFCGEDISIDAKRCPYCGSILNVDNGQNYDGDKPQIFNDGDSPVQNTDSYNSSGLFDNSINTNKDVKDFLNEEKYNEEMKGLFDNGFNDPTEENRGLFDADLNDPVEENINPQENTEGFIGDSLQRSQEQRSQEQRSQEQIFQGQRSQEQMSQEQIPQPQMPREQRPQDQIMYNRNMNNSARPQRTSVRSAPDVGSYTKPSLSNAMKVFLTSLSNFIPGLGQLIGVIIAIVYMNTEGDTDKRSFGLALLVNSIIVFVLWTITCCVFGIWGSQL